MKSIYLIGSLRNEKIPQIGNLLRANSWDAFDDWHAGGPRADDEWKRYETERGRTYQEALKGEAARHVFEFDKYHLDRCGLGVLVLPAGRSGHLELGYMSGQGKPSFVLLPDKPEQKLPEIWHWLTGLYEGEGCLTVGGMNRQGNPNGLQLVIQMRDKDIIERACAVAGVGKVTGPYVRDNPKWSDMWRFAVRRRDDVYFMLNGMMPYLGERRKQQVVDVFSRVGLDPSIINVARTPVEDRWDVMNLFATDIFTSEENMIEGLEKYR